MRYLLILAATFTFFQIPVAATSATITRSSNPICDYHLTGTIEVGDAQKLEVIPPSYDGLVLCLNSPGGSLTEGKAMFDRIWDSNIKTHILAGEACESACAIAFLGGSIETGTAVIRFQQRSVEAGARLGFHAPSLALTSGNSYSADQVNFAFEVALKSAEALFAVKLTEGHDVRAMTDFLYQRILGTRPETMYYIETIGDAVMANIDLLGLRYPKTIGEAEITHLCDNAWASRMADGQPDFQSAAAYYDQLKDGTYGLRRTTIEYKNGTTTGRVYDYYTPTKFGSLGCQVDISDGWERWVDATDGDGPQVYFVPYSMNDNFAVTPQTDITASFYVPYWYMLDPRQKIGSLAKTSAPVPQQTAPPPKVEDKEFSLFLGYDLFGGDIRDGVLRLSTGSGCLAACQERAGCDAATYDRWNKICYLKSTDRGRGALYVLSKAETYVQLSKVRSLRYSSAEAINVFTKSNKAFRDTPYIRYANTALETCKAQCRDKKCLGFNWQKSTGQCALFDRPGEYFDAAGYEAGFKQQVTQ